MNAAQILALLSLLADLQATLNAQATELDSLRAERAQGPESAE